MAPDDESASRIDIENPADGVRLIAFNRPEVRNAFDTSMYLQVTKALVDADGDPSVSAVVLTGRGSAFTSGQDLAEMAAMATGTAVPGAGRGFMGLLEAVTELSVPLLAAVNGVAVGLGFTLLAHCDLVLVDRAARLRVPFAELGVPPEAASSVLFPARVGWQQAARILLTSDWVSATEAVDLGFALTMCAEGTTLSETLALAGRIATHPRAATRAITSLMRAGQHDIVHAANRREQAAFAGLLGQAASTGTLAEFAAKVPS
jgi:enoyl-CoA hydratase/carnithine racemase